MQSIITCTNNPTNSSLSNNQHIYITIPPPPRQSSLGNTTHNMSSPRPQARPPDVISTRNNLPVDQSRSVNPHHTYDEHSPRSQFSHLDNPPIETAPSPRQQQQSSSHHHYHKSHHQHQQKLQNNNNLFPQSSSTPNPPTNPQSSPGLGLSQQPLHQQDRRQLPNSNHQTNSSSDDYSNYQPLNEQGISQRMAPMWSPSSDISPSNKDQNKSARTATQAEIDKLDELLQELTPRLNDSPSEYLRRRRQSFSNSGGSSGANRHSQYEGRNSANRQQQEVSTFIQGFSPTSPRNTDEVLMTQPAAPTSRYRASSQTDLGAMHMDNSSNVLASGMPSARTRHASGTSRMQSGWHLQEKRRLQRTRSLLDEKDRYLTEQLRRYQLHKSVLAQGVSPMDNVRPGSSQQIRPVWWVDEGGYLGSGGTGVGYPYGQWHAGGTGAHYRRATSEADYPLMNHSGVSSGTGTATATQEQWSRRQIRHQAFVRHNSADREDLSQRTPQQYANTAVIANNHIGNTNYQRNANYPRQPYSPNYQMQVDSMSPAPLGYVGDYPNVPTQLDQDIPLVYRRNIRGNTLSTRQPTNVGALNSPMLHDIDTQPHQQSHYNNRNAGPPTNYQHMPGVASKLMESSQSPMTILDHTARQSPHTNLAGRGADTRQQLLHNNDSQLMTHSRPNINTPDLLNKARHSGFQIRADTSARTSGISYHDPCDDQVPSTEDHLQYSSMAHASIKSSYNNTINQKRSATNSMSALKQEDSQLNYHSANEASSSSNNELPMSQKVKHSTKSNNNNTNSSIRKTAKIWYQPNMTREEAIKFLRNKVPGSFIIRQSHTFNNSYGLAVKVPRANANDSEPISEDIERSSIRHFLIETSNRGVRIRGCPNEPHFGSLTALVHQHTLTKLALPVCLVLPAVPPNEWSDNEDIIIPSSRSQITAQATTNLASRCFSALYLGSIDTETLSGPSALTRATEVLLEHRGQVRQTEVSIKVAADSLTLTDVQRRLFFRRHYPLSVVSYCAACPDTLNAAPGSADASTASVAFWESAELRSKGISKARIFGFVARKSQQTHEHMCHLFCEYQSQDSARTIINFISNYLHNS